MPGEILHASCIEVAGRAALILGASGSGKSALALQLMALGAGLIADDRTVLTRSGVQLIASAPETISGLIEARGVGILNAVPSASAPVALAIDMDVLETQRLPQCRESTCQGIAVPLLRRVDHAHFAPAILQFLKAGRSAR